MPSSLQVDIYVAPAIRAETGLEEPSKQLWSPICCTLIQGPTLAVLVDTPTPVELAQGLFEWVKKTAPGKKLRYIYTIHAHGDHFYGNPVLKNFPEAKCVATSFVNQGIEKAVSKENCPESLPANGEFSIDGYSFFGIDVTFSDTNYSSFLHMPAIDLVVAGDIACTAEKRRHWLDALSQITQLKPSMVIPGHKRASQDALKKWNDPAKVEESMKKRYPARWNDFILDRSYMASVAEKLQANEKAPI
ncbi:beta-lactamase-like protein [Aspergillus transmontanensis]|uniref:Beta-lactamase-like protein n=1 Tax=Aspergillus transmontanensis TaxID=1034304 RepID=A0A5N6VMY6_9EURO|nr:beta-lactamase-like protein [Aspergillus transmontanensis]